MARVLTALGFAIPVVAYLVFIGHYQVNVVFGDQWQDVTVIRHSYAHFFDWSSLWSLENGNRMLFPNLIVVALAHVDHFNIDVEEYLGALMLFAAIALFIWSHKRRSPDTPLIFYCPLAFLMLSFAQWQNTLWGYQMAWFLVILSLALTVFFLDRPTLSWPFLAAAGFIAVVGSYSLLQGLFIWPVGLVLLYHRRRPAWTFVTWTVAAVVTVVFYFHNYDKAELTSYSRIVFQHPDQAAKFYLYALGDVLGVPAKFGAPANAGVLLFGAVILVLALITLLRWGIRRDDQSAAPIGVALIVFGLLFDASITDGRIIWGIGAAAWSRYTTYDLLVLAGIYLTVVNRSSTQVEVKNGSRPTASARVGNLFKRVNNRVIRRVALAAIAVQLVFSIHYGLQGAQGVHNQYVATATATRNIDHESDAGVRDGLGIFTDYTGSWLRSRAEFLRTHHLSLFG